MKNSIQTSDVALNYFAQVEKEISQLSITFDKRKSLLETLQKGKESFQFEVERRKQVEMEKINLEREVELIKYDDLTGSLLKSYFETIKSRFKDYIVILGDLNDLKLVNDKYGHHEGDTYIQTFIEKIKSHLRYDDVIVRYGGGDEFLILIPEEDQEGIENIVKRLSEKVLEERYMTTNHAKKVVMSCAFGYCKGDLDITEKIKEADRMMYKNKKTMKWKVKLIKMQYFFKDFLENIYGVAQ